MKKRRYHSPHSKFWEWKPSFKHHLHETELHCLHHDLKIRRLAVFKCLFFVNSSHKFRKNPKKKKCKDDWKIITCTSTYHRILKLLLRYIWDMEIFSKNSIWFLKSFYLSIFRVPCLMSLIAKYFKISSFKGRTCIVDSQPQVLIQ